MRIHFLQHVPFEDLANIAVWAAAKGHVVAGTALFAGEALPDVDAFDWLIVMGGPMSVGDTAEYGWLAEEKAFIREAIVRGRAVLGVCLGAQLIADVLGAAVTRNAYKEIGWFPVTLTPEASSSPLLAGLPKAFPAFHWHGDTFAIPDGAVRVAESDACRNQAFVYGDRVLGLQFHLETSAESAERLMANCPEDLVEADASSYIQPAETIREGFPLLESANVLMAQLLDNLASI